jgi:mannose-6-phosphate isomerase
VQSGQALLRYLDTPVAGLWRDRMQLDGSFVDEPAPASSFYHIVCAIAELDRAIGP